jgi:hypothetical protein
LNLEVDEIYRIFHIILNVLQSANSTFLVLVCSSWKRSHFSQKNKRLKEAFGISEYYVDGSSLDPNRKAKEDEAKAVAMAQKKYA